MFKGSIVALITPFTGSGEVDFPALAALISWHCDLKADGIVLCGTTGETPTLTETEQQQILKLGVDISQGRVPIIAGTGCNDTRTTVDKTEQAKAIGVDACLLIVPYYNRPTPEGCYRHFEAVSRVGLPMIIYHHPGRTGTLLPPAALARIATLPHVAAIKEATGDISYAIELLRLTSVPVFTGDDVLVMASMVQGCVGVISMVANIIPAEWKELCNVLLNNDFAHGKELYQRYLLLVKAIGLETNPQCVKYAVSLLNRCAPHMRLPLIEPRDENKLQVEATMQSLGLLQTDSITV